MSEPPAGSDPAGDLVIRGGLIVDGSGRPGFDGDVALTIADDEPTGEAPGRMLAAS